MSPQFLLFAQHGWADTSRAIASLAHTIVPPETPVIAPDLGWLRTWLRIEPLIQQVEAAATKALEDYPDHAWRIMGHSMGGLIWIELLHRHPEWQFRVHSLALVGAPVGGSDLGRIIDPLGLGIAIARDLGVNRRPLAEAIAAQVPTVVIAGDSDGGAMAPSRSNVQKYHGHLLSNFQTFPTLSSKITRWLVKLFKTFGNSPKSYHQNLIPLPAN